MRETRRLLQVHRFSQIVPNQLTNREMTLQRHSLFGYQPGLLLIHQSQMEHINIRIDCLEHPGLFRLRMDDGLVRLVQQLTYLLKS